MIHTVLKMNKQTPRSVKAASIAAKNAARSLRQRKRVDDSLDEYFGCFRNSALWNGDSVALVREQRDV